jgi:hypothetical protein
MAFAAISVEETKKSVADSIGKADYWKLTQRKKAQHM